MDMSMRTMDPTEFSLPAAVDGGADEVTDRAADPTETQFAAYRAMYDHFNRTVFDGSLQPVLLTFSRKANTLGCFAPMRWIKGESTTHEISLNPSYFATRTPREIASTLVHEMAHLWQLQYGHFGKRGYHNQEWAAKMESIGLMPSSTGAPGGARIGFRMSHYIIEGGLFAVAFDALPEECREFPWTCVEIEGSGVLGLLRKKLAARSKVKYSCPSCEANAWGKPGLRLVCGECEFCMVTEDGDGARGALDGASGADHALARWAA